MNREGIYAWIEKETMHEKEGNNAWIKNESMHE